MQQQRKIRQAKIVGWGDWTPQFIMENWYKLPNPFATTSNKIAQKSKKNTHKMA